MPYGLVTFESVTVASVLCANRIPYTPSADFSFPGFGPDAFQLNGRREASDAVHKAAGVWQPVTQKVAMQVKGD